MMSRRMTKVPLDQLQDQLENAEEEISNLIESAQDLSMSEGEDNLAALTLFANQFKVCSRSFRSLSKLYASRLCEAGSYNESNQALSIWNEKSEKIVLLRSNLNAMLRKQNLDTISSWDSKSTMSGYSLTSHLDACVEQQSSDEAVSFSRLSDVNPNVLPESQPDRPSPQLNSTSNVYNPQTSSHPDPQVSQTCKPMLATEGNLDKNNFEFRNNDYARLNTNNVDNNVTVRSLISQIDNIIGKGICLGEPIHENIDTEHNHSDTIITCNTPAVSQTTLVPSPIHSDNHNDTQYFYPIATNVSNRTQFIAEPDNVQKYDNISAFSNKMKVSSNKENIAPRLDSIFYSNTHLPNYPTASGSCNKINPHQYEVQPPQGPVPDQSHPPRGYVPVQSQPPRGYVPDQSQPPRGYVPDQSQPHRGYVPDQSQPPRGCVPDQSQPHRGYVPDQSQAPHVSVSQQSRQVSVPYQAQVNFGSVSCETQTQCRSLPYQSQHGSVPHCAQAHCSFVPDQFQSPHGSVTDQFIQNNHNGHVPLPSHNFQEPYHPSSALSIVSNHLLETQIITKSIEKYDGTAHKFWPWVDKIQEYAKTLNLTPMRTLQLWESYTEGSPQSMISRARSAMGQVTQNDVDTVWRRLAQRYASPQQISAELREMLVHFTPIKGKDIGDQLLNLLDICQIISFNKRSGRCPQLSIMDQAEGIKDIRDKLPINVQVEWAKFGQKYENSHGFGSHPPFEKFIEFLDSQSLYKSNKNYEILTHHSPAIIQRSFKAMKTEVLVDEQNDQTAYQKEHHPATYEKPGHIPFDGNAYCVYHKFNGHNIFSCGVFKKLSHEEKVIALKERDRCELCTGNHKSNECKSTHTCKYCQGSHINFMHEFPKSQNNSQNYS